MTIYAYLKIEFLLWFQADKERPVLVAGDPERIHMAKVDGEGGIRYHVNQIKNCDDLAKKFNVRPIGSI